MEMKWKSAEELTMSTARQVQFLYKVLVTSSRVPVPVLEYLQQNKCKIIVCQSAGKELSRKKIIQEVSNGVDAIFWANHKPLNGEILNAAGSQLKAVTTMSAGIDYVDIEEFKRRNMPLGHTPKAVKNAVAELAIALMIASGRCFQAGRRTIENSRWDNRMDWLLGYELRGSVIGFLGFGGIGQAIAKRLKNWQVKKIIYHTRTESAVANAYHVSFAELLEESDFLVVACPLTEETKGRFDAAAFKKMKNNCVFVNVARGGVVDQSALYEALITQQIFSAGLDVMTPEPLSAKDPLLQLDNFVVIPHLGTHTKTSRIEMGLEAARNIINVLEKKPMISPAY